MNDIVKIFNEAMELTCLGLYDKKYKSEKNIGFSYSVTLKKALDKFSLLNYICITKYGAKEDVFPTDETRLINMACKDIGDTINKIPEEIREKFQCSEWNYYSSLVSKGKGNCFYCTAELLDTIMDDSRFRKPSKSKNKELELASQKFIILLFEKSQEEYCEIRNFLEQKSHAYITTNDFIEDENIRLFKNNYPEIFDEAYEKVNCDNYEIKICKHCGLVLNELIDGTIYCVSERCSKKSKGFTVFDKRCVNGEVWALKENVARYIYYPGILEQKILKVLKKFNIKAKLWPMKDTLDFEFVYKGKLFGVDAKDVKNPRYIINDVDIILNKEETRKYDKIIYVVPSDKKKDYLESIRRTIIANPRIECMSVTEFSRMLENVGMII